LIELLIVVAIIGILAAIAIPNLLHAQTRAKVAAVRANFTTLATAVETYYVDNDRYGVIDGSVGLASPGKAAELSHHAERLSVQLPV